jgi:hypothetical protein
MRLNRGDRIAGVDGLQLRRYFQRFGSEQVNYATVMDELSVTKRQAEKLATELLKLEMISRCEFQHDKSCFRRRGSAYDASIQCSDGPFDHALCAWATSDRR